MHEFTLTASLSVLSFTISVSLRQNVSHLFPSFIYFFSLSLSVFLSTSVAGDFLAAGGQKRVSDGQKSPSGIQGQSPVGVLGKAARSRRQIQISRYDREDMQPLCLYVCVHMCVCRPESFQPSKCFADSDVSDVTPQSTALHLVCASARRDCFSLR